MTPPVGTAMLSVCHILDCATDEHMKEGMPYLLAIFAEVLLLIFVPQIATGLETLMYDSC